MWIRLLLFTMSLLLSLYYRSLAWWLRSSEITDGDLLSYSTFKFRGNRLCLNPFSFQTFVSKVPRMFFPKVIRNWGSLKRLTSNVSEKYILPAFGYEHNRRTCYEYAYWLCSATLRWALLLKVTSCSQLLDQFLAGNYRQHSLIPWSQVLFKKLIVDKLVKLPAFQGT
jgi:hypothetical protein